MDAQNQPEEHNVATPDSPIEAGPADADGGRRQFPWLHTLVALALGGAAGLGVMFTQAEDDDAKLDTIAEQLCEAINGESRLIASGMVGFAIYQAEDLGYGGGDVGTRMLESCPSLYLQLTED